MKTPHEKRKAAKPDRRCLECAYCVPGDDLAMTQVCRVHGKVITERGLWRKACAEFEPLDPSAPDDQ